VDGAPDDWRRKWLTESDWTGWDLCRKKSAGSTFSHGAGRRRSGANSSACTGRASGRGVPSRNLRLVASPPLPAPRVAGRRAPAQGVHSSCCHSALCTETGTRGRCLIFGKKALPDGAARCSASTATAAGRGGDLGAEGAVDWLRGGGVPFLDLERHWPPSWSVDQGTRGTERVEHQLQMHVLADSRRLAPIGASFVGHGREKLSRTYSAIGPQPLGIRVLQTALVSRWASPSMVSPAISPSTARAVGGLLDDQVVSRDSGRLGDPLHTELEVCTGN